MRIRIGMLLGVLICLSAHGQEIDSLWSRSYGGPSFDQCNTVLPTADGGYIIAGSWANPATYTFAWVIKCDANGDSVWSRHFGDGNGDNVIDLQPTSDGGYIMAGITYNTGGGDYSLRKLDVNGNEEWEQSYGTPALEQAHNVLQTADGGYVLMGFSQATGNSDFWFVRTNSVGDSLTSQRHGGGGQDLGWGMNPTPDGGYMLAGVTSSTGAGLTDMWVVKVNEDGVHQWDRSYGSPLSDQCYAITPSDDGGFYLSGMTQGFGAALWDYWLVRIESDGDTLWTRRYGGPGFERVRSMETDNDGNIIMAGFTTGFGSGANDMWLVKAAPNGDSLWSMTLGTTGGERANCMVPTADGGHIVVGYIDPLNDGFTDHWLVKTGVVGGPLTPPESLTIHARNDSLYFYWSMTVGSVDYALMSSESSDGPFESVEGITSGLQLGIPASAANRKFFAVVARDAR